MSETEISDELIKETIKYEENIKERESNPNSRKETFFILFALTIETIRWIWAFFIALLFILFFEALKIAILTGLLILSIFLRAEGLDIRDAIDTNDTAKLMQVVKVAGGLYILINILISLLQIGISLWNIMIRPILIVITLAYQILRPIAITVFSFFGDIAIELALIAVELFIILLRVFSDILSELSGSFGSAPDSFGPGFTGGLFESSAFGSSVGSDGEFGGVISLFAPISRLFIRFGQLIFRGLGVFFIKMGPRILIFGDFILSIVLKFLPIFVDILLIIVDILNPEKALGLLIFSLTYALYTVQLGIYGSCSQIKSLLMYLCSFVSMVNKALRKLEKYAGIKIDIPSPCNKNSLNINCGKKPKKPSQGGEVLGAGLCDEAQCVQDTVDIIGMIQMDMGDCSDWIANRDSALRCMKTVEYYSINNTTSTAAASIDTISKELCFVLLTVILNQCQSGMPAFGFSKQLLANDVCVSDKSGLSPPALSFNAGCACVFSTPMCDENCCNQYALHTVGQIKHHIGGYQCGTILTTFNDQYWCQFEASSVSNLTFVSDLTFAATWCAAYREVVYPACSFSSPLVTLNSLNIVALVADFSSNFCNSTINQTGVCVPINTVTDPDFIQIQFEQLQADVDDLYVQIDAIRPLGFAGTPIVITPFVFDTVDEIIEKDISGNYCYYHFLMFKPNPLLSSSRNSPLLSVIDEYCAIELADSYASFDFSDVLGAKLRTPDGDLIPVNLPGIPSNVLVFGGIIGASLPDQTDGDIDCGFEVGGTVTELADQSNCATMSLKTSETAMTTVDSSAIDAREGLDLATQAINPAKHITPTSGSIDPSDPDFEQKTTDRNTLAVSMQQPTDWHSTPASMQTDETSTYLRIYTNGKTIGDSEFTMRHLTSFDYSSNQVEGEDEDEDEGEGENEEDEEEKKHTKKTNKFEKITQTQTVMSETHNLVSELKQSISDIFEGITIILNKATVSNPTSGNKESVFSSRKARVGKNMLKLLLSNFLEKISNSENKPNTVDAKKHTSSPKHDDFLSTRKLLSTLSSSSSTNYTSFSQEIGSIWDRLSDMYLQENTISKDILNAYNTDEVQKNVKYLASNGWKTGYALVNFFYALDTTSSDFGFSDDSNNYESTTFGADTNGVDPDCRNSQEEPLKCCVPGASSYQCCRGNPDVCIKEVPKWFYATVTTMENVREQWYCDDFVGFTSYLWTVIKCLTTVVFRAFSLVAGTPGFYYDIFGGLVYKDLQMPSNWLGCSILYSMPIWIAVFSLFIINILITSQRFFEMAIIVKQRSDIITIWGKLNELDKSQRLNKSLEKVNDMSTKKL
jgi:hypothetical protein